MILRQASESIKSGSDSKYVRSLYPRLRASVIGSSELVEKRVATSGLDLLALMAEHAATLINCSVFGVSHLEGSHLTDGGTRGPLPIRYAEPPYTRAMPTRSPDMRAVPIEHIMDVKFAGKYETKISDEEIRKLLTMKLDWGGQPVGKSVEVGMAYVQKGIRWIPNYRIELDGKGKAVVKLQATILNELTDLKDATVNLVVGVPSCYFKETSDPIALSQVVAQLPPYFQTDASTQYALSNAMMTQVARGGELRQHRIPPAAGAPDLGPEVGGGSQSEVRAGERGLGGRGRQGRDGELARRR